MTYRTDLIRVGAAALAAGSKGNWLGISSATAQAITLKDGTGTSVTFNMAAGTVYPFQVTEITTYAGSTGDLIGFTA